MDFIAAANRVNYRPTARQVEEWRNHPEPKPGKRGKLIKAAVPPSSPGLNAPVTFQGVGTLGINSRGLLANLLPALTKTFGGSAAQYAPSGPPEGFIKHLRRLGWVERDEMKGLLVTPLGRALMRADDQAETDDAAVQFVVLGANDPLAYARLIGHISDMNNALIVDPYLQAEGLFEILTHTDANRFLVGPKLQPRIVTQLQIVMKAFVSSHGPVELRQAPAKVLHDRYLIDKTKVLSIGGSINNIGKTTDTTLIPYPEEIADVVRGKAEEWWSRAEVLAVSLVDEDEDATADLE